jgi:hypothetical protein
MADMEVRDKTLYDDGVETSAGSTQHRRNHSTTPAYLFITARVTFLANLAEKAADFVPIRVWHTLSPEGIATRLQAVNVAAAAGLGHQRRWVPNGQPVQPGGTAACEAGASGQIEPKCGK